MQSVMKAFSHLSQTLRMHHLQIRMWTHGYKGILKNYEFKEVLSWERSRAERTGGALSLVVMWHVEAGGSGSFKSRLVMKHLANVVSKRIRCTDAVGHLDRGKLGVLLPHTYADSVWAVLRDSFEMLSHKHLEERVADNIVYRVYSNDRGGSDIFRKFEANGGDAVSGNLDFDETVNFSGSDELS